MTQKSPASRDHQLPTHLEVAPNEKTPLTSAYGGAKLANVTLPPYPKQNPPTKAAANAKTKVISKAPRTRKNVRDFRKKMRDFTTWKGRIGVYAEVDSIDIKELHEAFQKDPDGVQCKMVEHYDVLHIALTSKEPIERALQEHFIGGVASDDEETGANSEITLEVEAALAPHIFLFSFGPAVFWNFENAERELAWLQEKILRRFPEIMGEALDERAVESANDEIVFMYGDAANKFRQDTVTLVTHEAGEKLAVSFALAKSSLLSAYEWDLEQAIERNSHIPEELAKEGKIHMTNPEISKEIGAIFLIKHSINLDSNLHDTPEEFWEDDRFEDVYVKVLNYFEIDKRLRLVNDRLRMIQDLHQVLREQEENHHAVYLEWIVIILIVVEVVFDFIEPIYYHTFFSSVDPFEV